MTLLEQLKLIERLQKAYDNSTDRKAYSLGKQLRAKKLELATIQTLTT